jgi:hypothetical protein
MNCAGIRMVYAILRWRHLRLARADLRQQDSSAFHPNCLGLEVALRMGRYGSGAAPSSRRDGSFPSRLVVRFDCALPASLNGLAHTLFYAQSLQPPTTHLSQTPCRVLQASNVCQLLDIIKSMPWLFQRPFCWAESAPEGTRRGSIDPCSGFSHAPESPLALEKQYDLDD